MKRIISIILIIFNILSFAVYAEGEAQFEKEFELLSSCGVMTAIDEESMNAPITQGQFRETLASILVDNEAMIEKTDSFGEVYDASGEVTYIKALISLVKLVGYDDDAIQAGGTYNAGYRSIASKWGITKGVSCGENESITYAQAGKLIYNAINVPLMEISFEGSKVVYKTNEDKTILSEYMNIHEVRGIVNATSDYARPGYSTTQENVIIIGESEYTINSVSMNNYFGVEVVASYRYDEENDESKIVKISPRREESIFVLSASDIEEHDSVSGDYIYIEKETEKEKKISVTAGAQWFYNYEEVKTKAQLENMNFIPEVGEVRLLDTNNDSDYDIVIILDYDVRIADYVREDAIYTKNDAGRIIVNSDTKIKDAGGNPINSALVIGENNVVHTIFAEDGLTAKYIVVTSTVVEGTITRIDKDENVVRLSDDSEYGVTLSNLAFLDDLKSNTNVTLYIDMNGNFAGYKKGVTGDMLYGYMISLRTYDSEETGERVVAVKLFDVAEEKMKLLFTAEKFRIDGERYQVSSFDAMLPDFCDSRGVVYDQFIRYKLNKNGVISEMDFAYDGDDNYNPYGIAGFFPSKKDGLVKVAGSQLINEQGGTKTDAYTDMEWERARSIYWVSTEALSKRYINKTDPNHKIDAWATNLIVSGDTPVLFVPKNRQTEDAYYITTRAAFKPTSAQSVLDAYRVENETLAPSFIVAYEGDGVADLSEGTTISNNTNLITGNEVPALIVDIENVWLEEEDSEAYQLTLLHRGKEVKAKIKGSELITTQTYEVKNANTGKVLGTVTGLEPGDIIRYAEKGGWIAGIQMFIPKSMMMDYNRTDFYQLSRGIFNDGNYIGYAYARFDDTVMGLKTPHKAADFDSIDFVGDDIFMLQGMTVYEYNADKKYFEKSSLDCINFYKGTNNLEETSVIVVYGDGAGYQQDKNMYVINGLFE